MVHPFGDNGRANIGVRHTCILGLTSIITTSRMRVAENTANGCSLRVGFMAVSVKLLLAKSTFATSYIKRDYNIIAHFQLMYIGANFFYHANKLVAKGRPNPRIGHQAIV